MCRANIPSFPARRAFFVETDTRLAVYAYWGDRIAEDLRHEVAHGYLHACVPADSALAGRGLWLNTSSSRVNIRADMRPS